MKTILTIVAILFLTIQTSQAQTIEELYNDENFSELAKYADKANELTNEQLYYVGFAFFQLGDDPSAIKMYDKAIENGLDEDYIYYFKGLALRFNRQHEKAIENFKLAVERNPERQKNRSELANSYYLKEDYEPALKHFYKARELNYEIGDPYLKLPNIYHIKKDFPKALEEYRISADMINKEDPVYIELLKEIGLLEFAVFKEFEKSISAYEIVLERTPTDYDFYPKLIKSYYANEEYEKGERLINTLKLEFEKGNLSEDFQKSENVPIGEFDWNKQLVIVYKYFKEPQETLDLMYKIYVLSPDRKSIARTLMTEKTIQFTEDGAKHLLCEREKDGTHHTYSYGWTTDEIDYGSLKNAVIMVLDGELKPGASSNFAQKSTPTKKKGKKKAKKKKNKK